MVVVFASNCGARQSNQIYSKFSLNIIDIQIVVIGTMVQFNTFNISNDRTLYFVTIAIIFCHGIVKR